MTAIEEIPGRRGGGRCRILTENDAKSQFLNKRLAYCFESILSFRNNDTGGRRKNLTPLIPYDKRSRTTASFGIEKLLERNR
jgi:hypothetical protein